MKELMLDLETMGNTPQAPIVQIGAAYFKMSTGEVGDSMLINVHLADAIKHGAKPDGSTIMWWLGQEKEAQQTLSDKDIKMYREFNALVQFNKFVKKATRVWSHATFDFVIVNEAFRRRGIKSNMHYREARDIRTLTGLIPKEDRKELEREGIHHNALDDVMYQIKYCHAAYQTIQRFGYDDGYKDAELTYGNTN